MKQPASYVRVSTADQALSHLSLEAQAAACRSYCAFHWPGLTQEIFTDVAPGSRTNGRPALAALLADPSRFCAVVTLRLDRLARNALDLLIISRTLDAAHVPLHSVTESIDTHSAPGRLFLTVLAALAEFERDILSERTREALAAKRARGERLGAIPFGFDSHTGAPDPAELELVRRAHLLRRAGSSIREIASLLKLRFSTVRYVLENNLYRERHLL